MVALGGLTGGLQLLGARHAFRCAHELSHLVVATALLAATRVVCTSGCSATTGRARAPQVPGVCVCVSVGLGQIWSAANLTSAMYGSHVIVPKFGIKFGLGSGDSTG